MITKELEEKVMEKIVAKLAAVSGLPSYQVVGAWQPSAVGFVKNVEASDSVAVVAVALGTPSSPTFSSPEVVFTGAVNLEVRFDLDATGTAFVSFAEQLESLFKSWQVDTYQREFTTLDVPGLSVDEVSIGGGRPPIIDRRDKKVSVAFPFTLSGSYVPSSIPSDSSDGAQTPADSVPADSSAGQP